MIERHWPLLALSIRTPRLELRLPDDDELAELAELATRGVYRPGERPFFSRWPEKPADEVARGVVQRHWRQRGAWTADHWALEFTTFLDGRPIGAQQIRAKEFAALGEVESGSWLGLEHQGLGYGTEMRAAVLHLAFAELGAEYALSASFVDNASSIGVSRKVGYQPDGIQRDVIEGQVFVTQRFRMSRDDWRDRERPEFTVSGIDGCREMFGAGTLPTGG
ncbi:MAG TPA: GNAT family N-acetyltransferase [Actinospica sp.]|nr:GNAT family N-acetyltransferase [Actinospica sp.]